VAYRGSVDTHDRDERVSLAGPDPEDVLRALLRVDPESEPVEHRDDDPKDDPPAN
jgi:hypothetical protein